MTYSTPLAMSETKANFIKHLGLPSHVYAKMGVSVMSIIQALEFIEYPKRRHSPADTKGT